MQDADAKRAFRAPVQHGDGFLQLRFCLNHSAGSMDVQLSGLRQLNGRFSAGKDWLAQLRFDLANSLRERRLGDGQRLGGGSEAALLEDGEDHSGMACIHEHRSLS